MSLPEVSRKRAREEDSFEETTKAYRPADYEAVEKAKELLNQGLHLVKTNPMEGIKSFYAALQCPCTSDPELKARIAAYNCNCFPEHGSPRNKSQR